MSALAFLSPPPGLAPHVDFALEPVEAAEGLFTLTSSADPGVRLFAMDAAVVVPDYAPVLSDEQAGSLGLQSPDDASLLVVAQLTPEGIGVNLLAPVVVNRHTARAAQVILEGQDFPVRALLR